MARDGVKDAASKFIILFLPTILISTILITSCTHDKYVKEQGLIWNTSWHVTYKGDRALADSIILTLDQVGKSLNVFDQSSLVSRANISDSIHVDRHFATVYNSSRRIYEASGGFFDPTISPLIKAWGFGEGHVLSNDTARIDSIMKFTGIGRSHLNGNLLVKDDRRLQFNFSAIAKGYGCDAVADMFKRNGVSDYMVEIGGEIALGGKSPSGSLWRISIDTPDTSGNLSRKSATIVSLTDCGIATSGNYRNHRQAGGKTIGHTLSPATGRPVTTDVLSATVIAPTAMEADAAATACMAAGSTLAKQMIAQLGFDAFLILDDSITWHSAGFPK